MNIDKKDIRSLQDATSSGSIARSPNAVNGITRFYYFFPKNDKNISLIQSLLQKYDIPSQLHTSSLSPVPVVRVPMPRDANERMPNLMELLDLFERPVDLSEEQDTPLVVGAVEVPVEFPPQGEEAIQQQQIQKLKELTGLDFTFVPADKSPMHVKSYVTPQLSNEAFQKLRDHGLHVVEDVVGDGAGGLMVTENYFDSSRVWNTLRKRLNPEKFTGLVTESIGKINGHDVYLETFPNANSSVVGHDGRAMAVVNINGKSLPFYVSSGLAGKDKLGIPSGHWYPLMGIGQQWFNKMPDMMHNPAPELDQVVELLDAKFPPAEMREKALNEELPTISIDDLMFIANKDLPEGVQQTHYGHSPEYIKNFNVYLPAIIRAWRTPAKKYLETNDDVIGRAVYKRMQEIQKLIHVEITENDGVIRFLPNNAYDVPQYIRQELAQLGIVVNDNLEISVDEFMGTRVAPAPERPNAEPVAAPTPQLREAAKEDINALASMLASIAPVTSPTPVNGTTHFFYFMPKAPGTLDAILAILNKYGLPASPHMTGLNNRNFPILRIPDTNDIHDALAKLAYGVNLVIDAQRVAQNEANRRRQGSQNSKGRRDQFNDGQNQVRKKGLWQRMINGLTNLLDGDNHK